MRKRNKILACALAAAIFIATGRRGEGFGQLRRRKTVRSRRNGDNEAYQDTEESLKKIKATYDVKNQEKTAEEL